MKISRVFKVNGKPFFPLGGQVKTPAVIIRKNLKQLGKHLNTFAPIRLKFLCSGSRLNR